MKASIWPLVCALLLCSGALAPSFAQGTAPAQCKANAKYGGATLIGPQAAAALKDRSTMTKVLANGAFNNDKDEFLIQLYAGSGPFAKGIVPGTYPLGKGDDAKYETCGACVLLWADTRDFTQGDIYFAKSGTLTIEAVNLPGNKGRFRARVDNVTLTHIDYDFKTHVSTPAKDGCSVEISSATLDVPMHSFNCPFPPGGGDIVATNGTAIHLKNNKGTLALVALDADLSTASARLGLRLETSGTPPTPAIAPGTYELGTGPNASLGTCRQCVRLLAGGMLYAPRKGKMIIDSMGAPGGGNLTAKLTDLVMEHVTYDPNTRKETTIDDGCVTRIATLTINAPVK